MPAINLHLFAPLEGPVDLRGLQVAAPGQSPDERVVLWTGVPPSRADDHPVVAPVVLDGELDGKRTYAEQVPRGVWLAGAGLPDDLKPYVVSRLLDGLAALHAEGRVHGSVARGRVLLGADGEVVLVGRGRIGGREALDLLALDGIASADDAPTLEPSDPGQRARDLAVRSGPGDRERLAAWVAERMADGSVVKQVVLLIGGHHDAVDEVVPDLGPEATDGGRGILDRWTLTGTSGTASEVTDQVSTTQHALALTLWGRLSSRPRNPPRGDRFDAVRDAPSRAIRSILADEPPEALPLPLLSDPGAFVLRAHEHDDQPTMIGEALEPVAAAPAPPSVPVVAQWAIAMVIGGGLVWAWLTFGAS